MGIFSFSLNLDNDTILDDISRALPPNDLGNYRTIIHHKDYAQTMNHLAKVIFLRLSQDIADTCKQFGLIPVQFSSASFSTKAAFDVCSNTDFDTLGALVFSKFWHLDKVYHNNLDRPVESSYGYFWYQAFEDESFKAEVLNLFLPLVAPKEDTVSVTYQMFFRSNNALDVPKSIFDQGEQAIINYFNEQHEKKAIDLTYHEFFYESLIADGQIIRS